MKKIFELIKRPLFVILLLASFGVQAQTSNDDGRSFEIDSSPSELRSKSTETQTKNTAGSDELLSLDDLMEYYMRYANLYEPNKSVVSPNLIQNVNKRRTKVFQKTAVNAWVMATSTMEDINKNLSVKVERLHAYMNDPDESNDSSRALQDVIKLNTQAIIFVAEQFFPMIIMKTMQVELLAMRYIREDTLIYTDDIAESVARAGG